MHWFPKHVDSLVAAELAESLRDPAALRLKTPVKPQEATLLANLLAARGVTSAQAAQSFLFPSLSDLHSPFLMTGMKSALERLEAAIERKEKILIYGDYDVDGTTA